MLKLLKNFKYKRFRYQMTDYAQKIEEMTIILEELDVKVASLSPKRFEVLKNLIEQLNDINDMEIERFNELWKQITTEFKDLNQNYKDFLKEFQKAKTEELLESAKFLEYKNKIVSYLQDFIKGYLTNGFKIKEIMQNLPEDIETTIVNYLEAHQKLIPNMNEDYNYEKFREINKGKYLSIYNWFVGINGKSEGDRLLEVTNSIITQISKCVSSLVELHGNMIARKEEYKYLAKLFDNTSSLKEAHQLSNVIFGLENVLHFKGISKINTDSLINSYEVEPITIEIEPTEKRNRVEKSRVIVESKAKKKQEIIKNEQLRIQKEKDMLIKLVKLKEISLTGEVNLSKEERSYILNLISRANNKQTKENLLGLKYKIEPQEGICQIKSLDGTFTLDGVKIIFEGEINE